MDVTASLNGVYSCRATNPASKVYYDLKQYTLKITVGKLQLDLEVGLWAGHIEANFNSILEYGKHAY